MTFYEWLIRLKNNDTPTGDLAVDALQSSDFPKQSTDEAEILSYLRNKKAHPEAIKTFKSAWSRYQRYLRTHPDA